MFEDKTYICNVVFLRKSHICRRCDFHNEDRFYLLKIVLLDILVSKQE